MKEHKCIGCGKDATADNSDIISGKFRWRCKVCFKEWSKAYEKTPKGYLVRTYRNMLSRVKGIQKKKAHLYKGLEILDKKAFYSWSLNNQDFLRLHENYKVRNYDLRYAPSIDRRDSTKGYSLDNIRWITHSENSSLGSLSQKRKLKDD